MMTNTINEALLHNSEFVRGVSVLLSNKPQNLCILKAAEELNELATVLLQWHNKPENFNQAEFIQELIDVQMHLILLQQYYLPEELMGISDIKVTKMINSKDFKHYEQANKQTTSREITP